MPERAEFSVANTVFCEQIRNEIANKYTLIGVIGGNVFVPVFPANIAVCAYVEWQVTKIGDATTFFRWSGPGDEPALELRIDAQIHEPGLMALALPPGVLACNRPGSFKLEFRASEDAAWDTIIERTVNIGPN